MIKSLSILCFSLCCLFSSIQAFGQAGQFHTNIFYSPIMTQLHGANLQESGDKVGTFELKNTYSQEIGISETYNITENFGVGIGLSFKQFKFKSSFVLTDDFPLAGDIDITSNYIGYRGMVFYNLKKFNFQLIYDVNTFINSDMSFLGAKSNLGTRYEYGTGVENASVSHIFDMRTGGNHYYLPEVLITYALTPKIGIHTGLKFRTSDQSYYELRATSDVNGANSEYNAAVSYDFYFVHLGCSFELF